MATVEKIKGLGSGVVGFFKRVLRIQHDNDGWVELNGGKRFYELTAPVTAGETETTAPAGSFAVTSDETGASTIFVSDGEFWQVYGGGGGGSSLELGETEETAYRGDRGVEAYAHSQLTEGNPHGVTAADFGLENVENTADEEKPISTATQEAINAKPDLGETEETAYRGDQGAEAYAHSQLTEGNPHGVIMADLVDEAATLHALQQADTLYVSQADYLISGGGDADLMGVYSYRGMWGGFQYWNLEGGVGSPNSRALIFSEDDSGHVIYGVEADVRYKNSSGDPTDAWTVVDGVAPAPTVTLQAPVLKPLTEEGLINHLQLVLGRNLTTEPGPGGSGALYNDSGTVKVS